MVEEVSLFISSHLKLLDSNARFGLFDTPEKEEAYLHAGKFHLFAGLSYPCADKVHLETCLIFYLWAFAVRRFPRK